MTIDESHPQPATAWAGVDRTLSAASTHSSLFAARITPDGAMTLLHQRSATQQQPLASVAKLYVLAAVVDKIQRGEWSWQTRVTPAPSDRSGGSFDRERPVTVGQSLSIEQAARSMIYWSDNTATSMLVRLLGQSELARIVRLTGHSSPERLDPFPTVRQDMWLLWSASPAAVAARAKWPRASVAQRRALLAGADTGSLDTNANVPRWQAGLGYSASAQDVARVLSWLYVRVQRPDMGVLASLAGKSWYADHIDPPNDMSPLVRVSGWRPKVFKSGGAAGVSAYGWVADTPRGTVVLVTLAAGQTKPQLAPTVDAATRLLVTGH